MSNLGCHTLKIRAIVFGLYDGWENKLTHMHLMYVPCHLNFPRCRIIQETSLCTHRWWFVWLQLILAGKWGRYTLNMVIEISTSRSWTEYKAESVWGNMCLPCFPTMDTMWPTASSSHQCKLPAMMDEAHQVWGKMSLCFCWEFCYSSRQMTNTYTIGILFIYVLPMTCYTVALFKHYAWYWQLGWVHI